MLLLFRNRWVIVDFIHGFFISLKASNLKIKIKALKSASLPVLVFQFEVFLREEKHRIFGQSVAVSIRRWKTEEFLEFYGRSACLHRLSRVLFQRKTRHRTFLSTPVLAAVSLKRGRTAVEKWSSCVFGSINSWTGISSFYWLHTAEVWRRVATYVYFSVSVQKYMTSY